MMLAESRFLMLAAMCFVLAMSASAAPVRPKRGPTPVFRTEVVGFEDSFLYGTPSEGSLVYRTEGGGGLKRVSEGKARGFFFTRGEVACIHPAQYDRPTLRLRLTVTRGEPGIAICHNGMRDNSGKRNPSPGLEIVLREHDTVVRDLATGEIIAVAAEAFPRGRQETLSVAWDFDARKVRIDLPQGSYQFAMPAGVSAKGGFGLRAPATPETRFRVSKVQVLWQDQREVVLYDGHETIYDLDGKLLGHLPAVTLPEGVTTYCTTAVDLRMERSLLLLGGSNLNVEDSSTFRGWAVRDLRTGKLDIVSRGSHLNGCLPVQGGGGMDGYWLLQSWHPPASTCWLDWNAYQRGDREHFVVPALSAVIDGPKFTAFHDPANALDGSLARYLRITESWRGVTHLTVHPNIAPFAPFADFATPPPTDPAVSHTGPAGMPTQIAVRDRDRAWYEQWAYVGGNVLHTQNRGYNLFSREDDWASRFYPTAKDAEAYTDFANMAPVLTEPGKLLAPLYRFAAREAGPKRTECLGIYRLRVGDNRFIVGRAVSRKPWPGVFEILFDRTELLAEP
jgi:hypothetical protein